MSICLRVAHALVLLLLLPASLQAQDRSGQFRGGAERPGGSISGAVVDSESGDPIESATIAVWNQRDSSLVTGAITVDEGRFLIEGLRPGHFYVKVSFIGFRTETIADITLRPDNPNADLGTIRLAADTAFLDEVEVTAERQFMEVGIDRTVYNVKDQLVSAGGSAQDVLENIPSVEVDIDGRISLRGSQNVAILINGRPTSMSGDALVSFLQGLPSNAIERVEVIPNPSARYEPDGMSGILNIVLARDRARGIGGSVNLGGGTQGSYNASGSVNYNQGALNALGSYSFRRNTRDTEGTRFRENRFALPLSFLDQADFGDRSGFSHVLNTSFDYNLSAKNTLSLASILSLRTGESAGLRTYRELDDDRELTSRFERTNDGDRRDLSADLRLAFKRTIDPGKHELSLEARYETEDEDDDALHTERLLTAGGSPDDDTPDLQQTNEEELGREGSLQMDYVRPFASGKVEAGYKGSFRRLDSEFFSQTFRYDLGRFAPDEALNNSFLYDEDIHAAYGIISQDVGRFGAQIGLRLEQALTNFNLTTTSEDFENNYFSLFPSAFLTYQLSEGQTARRQLKLSYSKRINRPNTWQLNPFDNFNDPRFRRLGNPYLRPEYIHALEASFIQFSGNTTLTVTPYFRRTVDVIRWHESLSDEGVSLVTFRNFDSNDSWGAEAIGTLRLSDWLNVNASFNAYRVVTDGSNVDTDLSNDAYGWMTRGSATFNVRPDLAVQLSYFYRAPMDIENGRIGSFSRAEMGIRQQLFGQRGSLNLRVRDPFNTMGFNMEREDDRFFTTMSRKWQSREVNLSFTYNFGRQENRRRRGNFERPERDPDMEEMQM